MEDVLIEVPKMRRFAGIALITDRIPDGTTILVFWHLLEENNFGEQIFEAVKKTHLKGYGMAMRQVTIVDATIIAQAPPRMRSGCGIRRCIRPRKATSGTTACSRRPAHR